MSLTKVTYSMIAGATANVLDFGATGNGSTSDTAAIQSAIDAVYTAGGGTVFFPAGTYYVSQFQYYEGVTFQGVGAGSVLKKIPSSDSFLRMFTTLTSDVFAVDSKLMAWKDLAFDGNSPNAGPYNAYQLEHQALIFLAASASGAGKRKVLIDGCTFINCVADAISVYNNIDLTVTNCWMRECFRGGLVITGGYSVIKGSNLDMRGTTDLSKLDIEVDGAGYGSTLAITAQLSNIYTQNGFEISCTDSDIRISNSIAAKSDASSTTINGTGNIQISNSVLNFSVADGAINRIFTPSNTRFDNCEITYFRPTTTVGAKTFGIDIYWDAGVSDCKVAFNNCNFYVDSSIQVTDTVNAISSLYNVRTLNDNLSLTDCNIFSGFTRGIANRGGTTLIKGTVIDAITAMFQDSADASGYEMTVDNVSVGSTTITWMYINTSVATTGIFIHRNVLLDTAFSAIGTGYGYTTNVFKGSREIYGASSPGVDTPGLPGDTYRLSVPVAGNVYEWVCTGYSGSDVVWKAATTLAA